RLERGRILDLAPHLEAARRLIRVDIEVNRSQAPAESAAESLASECGEGSEVPSGEAAGEASEPRRGDAAEAGRKLLTTSGRSLDYSHPAMRLWTKAKRDGIWDPFGIDLERDRADWQRLDAVEREVLLDLTSQFQAGEESVARDLVPLLDAVASDGSLEEELFLASFLWEEAKHVELFHRFLDEVVTEPGDLERFHGPAYRRIFHDELPRSLARLREDASAVALAEASVTYNMIVEGVLAETGYHAYHQMLAANELMPGMRRAIGKLKRDESRHIAYGVFLLSRLVATHGDDLWQAVDRRMSSLLPVALESVREFFERHDRMPFGLELEHFAGFATQQFERRYARIELARRQSLEQILATGETG
ncbi:MAG: R2-like ligand-binding oxidase, partial [Thermoanaerobaculia bacterium]|nr:R2-like ligand-binding oxidase [Thermoanaerobaculia bacterium]